MKKQLSIENEISFMSLGWKCECNPESVGWSHGKFDEWKVIKFEEICFELRKKGEVSGNLSFRTKKSFLTLKFGLE